MGITKEHNFTLSFGIEAKIQNFVIVSGWLTQLSVQAEWVQHLHLHKYDTLEYFIQKVEEGGERAWIHQKIRTM